MDKIQFLTIVITAAISVIAKELVTWLVTIIKDASAIKSAGAKLRVVFSKSNRVVMMDAFVIVFYISVLVNFGRGDSPPTRLEILIVIGAVLALIFMAIALVVDIVKAMGAHKKSKGIDAQP